MGFPKPRMPDALVPVFPEGMYRVEWMEAGQLPVFVQGNNRPPTESWIYKQRSTRHPDPAIPISDLEAFFAGKPFVSVVVNRKKENAGCTSHDYECYFVDEWEQFHIGRFSDPFCLRALSFAAVNSLAYVRRGEDADGSNIQSRVISKKDTVSGYVFPRLDIARYPNLSVDSYLYFLYVGDDAVREVLDVAFQRVRRGYWAPDRDTLLDLIDLSGMSRLALEVIGIKRYVADRLNAVREEMKAAEDSAAQLRHELAANKASKARLQPIIGRLETLLGLEEAGK